MPLFWPRRLDQPVKRKKPARIVVVSMGDLFGDWVPAEWIEQVFAACEAAPQHTYYFLTKNDKRYMDFIAQIYPQSNWWMGRSSEGRGNFDALGASYIDGVGTPNNFISLEPLLFWDQDVNTRIHPAITWLIVGSETRNGRPVNMPKRGWILDIRQQCKELKIPLFEKNSLAGLQLPGGLIQEWPE